MCRLLLANQDTELTKNHSGWKANESGVDWGGPPCPSAEVPFWRVESHGQMIIKKQGGRSWAAGRQRCNA